MTLDSPRFTTLWQSLRVSPADTARAIPPDQAEASLGSGAAPTSANGMEGIDLAAVAERRGWRVVLLSLALLVVGFVGGLCGYLLMSALLG